MVYVDQHGSPYHGKVPQAFNFSQLARDGVGMPTMGGLYTDEQLEALQQQTSRGDAVDSIANHLAARIVETKHSFFSYTTQLNQQLQHDLERAPSTEPLPIFYD